MAVALETFVKQLEDSGIIAAGKLKDFIPPSASPKDAESLAKELIKAGKLTPFQAQHVLAGKFKALVLGNYTIVDHALARTERGLAGMLVVGGNPNPEIYTSLPGPGPTERH